MGGAAASESKGGGVIAHRPERGTPRPAPTTGIIRRARIAWKMRQSQRAEQRMTELEFVTRSARWPLAKELTRQNILYGGIHNVCDS
jgi:hypothetical protein